MMTKLGQTPAPGEQRVRFVGDRVAFALSDAVTRSHPAGWRAFLRTNIGRAGVLRAETIAAVEEGKPPTLASWRDIPLTWRDGAWRIELPLAEVGWFEAKAYAMDPEGWQHWPDGPNAGFSVQPAICRTANTIYCAFPRMFGPNKPARTTVPNPWDDQLRPIDQQGYTVIPPSGTLRELQGELPHIFDRLGCRILHLLPIHPTPTTFARFGRFGSPYACQDLLAIDPALVEFDQRTTGLDQFRELARAVHARKGRLFLDIVINHTGWGSTLWENRPEWFERQEDGAFKSPGAWGNIWGDLVELRHDHPELRRYIADALLEWCRRGVDGFRCDAGYMVPLEVWRYIVARVRQEFPNTVFLLEGLGGSWEDTETLLTHGNLQWAYSELFQNYSGTQVAWYLDYALARSRDRGLYVHYSETHDNARLGAKGRAWSLLRNRLCALTSVSGGFGFTCGVEWLAAEQVNVHSSRGLSWGNPENLLPELRALNHLLAEHPCFFDGAALTRLSGDEDPVFALLRIDATGLDAVLVLVNNDTEQARKCQVELAPLRGAGLVTAEADLPRLLDLLGQDAPASASASTDATAIQFSLEPAAAFCLASQRQPVGQTGADYRARRAREAFTLTALSRLLPVETLGGLDLATMAGWVDRDPEEFLAATVRASRLNPDSGLRPGSARGPRADSGGPPESPDSDTVQSLLQPGGKSYPPVIHWDRADARRVTAWPVRHWLLVSDDAPFRAVLRWNGGATPDHLESTPVAGGHVAAFWPSGATNGEVTLELERYGESEPQVSARLRLLDGQPRLEAGDASPGMALLTNGIGGMARLPVDFGTVRSKYDCLLGANLHPRVPVDRHVLAKRARLWVNADGFSSPLDAANLVSFEPGPPARWRFRAHAGDGRTAEIEVEAAMPPGKNTTVLRFHRPARHAAGSRDLPSDAAVRLSVRVDVEDRSFHQETKHNSDVEHHFRSHTQPLTGTAGFDFRPAAERHLRVGCDQGRFHAEPEWCFNIPHPVEQSRGQEDTGDAFSPGWFEIPMPGGTTATMRISAEPASREEPATTSPKSDAPRTGVAKAASGEAADPFEEALRHACQAFVVRRDAGKTIIAGYPWFLDWGRDTLICARGLLAAGRPDEVLDLLKVFGRFEANGTLPNAIHGENASNRESSGAPLWYGLVCEELAALAGPSIYETCIEPGDRTLAEILCSIAANYLRGTPNGIHVDPGSALVWSPSHFTWMDTNHPAATPREGYPVEIQALWVRLLQQLARLDLPRVKEPWSSLAERALASLESLFWLEGRGWLADELVAPQGRAAADAQPRDALRSNCLLPVALGLLSGDRARRLVRAAQRWLVVPGALRSLAPLRVTPPLPVRAADGHPLNDPERPYWGHYQGDEDTRRKPAYHNGTAWTWTFPVFCEALARAWDFEASAVATSRACLAGMDALLREGCCGQLPEIIDGDAPHTQRGCDAQAWGVTEALRVWRLLGKSSAGSGA